LRFLIDTSNCKEQQKKQEDITRRKKLLEKRISGTDSVNSGSGPDYQIYTLLVMEENQDT
jgi:hypothetical protein